MAGRDIDLDEIRSRPPYRAYLVAWRSFLLGLLLLGLTGLLTALGVSRWLLAVAGLAGMVIAAGGVIIAVLCTIGLLPVLGRASPRRQVAVIAMVARDVVRPRLPPDRPSGM
jgi:hypothetical protein